MSRAKIFIITTVFAGLTVAAMASGQPLEPAALPHPQHFSGPQLTASMLYANAVPFVKVLMTLALLTIPAALAGLGAALIKPDSAVRMAAFLRSASDAAAAAGGLGAAWGIMNTFIGIANTNTTNIAVIAPGMAESMMCLAFGLLAALIASVAAGVLEARRPKTA